MKTCKNFKVVLLFAVLMIISGFIGKVFPDPPELPEILRTGTNPTFIIIQDNEESSVLDDAFLFAYVKIDEKNTIVGKSSRPYQSGIGALITVMLNEGLGGDDPSAPDLRTGAWYKDEILIGVIKENKFYHVNLKNVAFYKYNDDGTDKPTEKLLAYPLTLYRIQLSGIGTQITDLFRVPYLDWFYGHPPEPGQASINLIDTPKTTDEISVQAFKPSFCSKYSMNLFNAIDSKLIEYKMSGNTVYNRVVIPGMKDLQKGYILLRVEATGFAEKGSPVMVFDHRINFPPAPTLLVPDLNDKAWTKIAGHIKIQKVSGGIRFYADKAWGVVPELEVSVKGTKVMRPEIGNKVLYSTKVLSGTLDITVPANVFPDDGNTWKYLFIEFRCLYSKYFKSMPLQNSIIYKP